MMENHKQLTQPLDLEWVSLLLACRRLGMTIEEVRAFLTQYSDER